MMVWFLNSLERLDHERKSIKDLSQSCDWLKGFSWKFQGSALRLDADIVAHDHIYSVYMGSVQSTCKK